MNNDPIIQSQSLYSAPDNNVTVYTEMTVFTAEGQSGVSKNQNIGKSKENKTNITYFHYDNFLVFKQTHG